MPTRSGWREFWQSSSRLWRRNKIKQSVADRDTGLRIAPATAFLSVVAGRLGLWGRHDSGWEKFVKYTESVNWYLPLAVVPAAPILETCFGLALLIGWQTRKAAVGSSVLLTLFAVAMFSGDPKSPFDYSVFTAAFGALTLATHPARD